MDLDFQHFSALEWVYAISIAFGAGLVKGLVGFGMPMLIISGLSVIFDPVVAIAAMVLPTLITNLFQTFSQGITAGAQAMRYIGRFLIIAGVVLVITSQFTGMFSQRILLLLIGCLICVFCGLQIFGLGVQVSSSRAKAFEPLFALVSGFFGGLAGIWGPALVAYLTSLNTPKDLQIRAQGVAFALGSLLLVVAQLASGVLNSITIPLSLALIVPSTFGMLLSQQFQPYINQHLFRRMTLFVLLVAGLNLLRRGLLGT